MAGLRGSPVLHVQYWLLVTWMCWAVWIILLSRVIMIFAWGPTAEFPTADAYVSMSSLSFSNASVVAWMFVVSPAIMPNPMLVRRMFCGRWPCRYERFGMWTLLRFLCVLS